MIEPEGPDAVCPTNLFMPSFVMDLQEKRKDIDAIDAEILSLLNRRAALVQEIGKLKLQAGLPLVDWDREAEIIRRAASYSESALPDEAANRIYRAILRETRQIELELAQEVTLH